MVVVHLLGKPTRIWHPELRVKAINNLFTLDYIGVLSVIGLLWVMGKARSCHE
jgi:hypothetical protein